MDELGASPGAEISIETGTDAGGARVIGLSGEVDTSNVDRLEDAIAAILRDHPERVIFDLGALRFMDSAGIAVIVRVAAEVETVRIRDPSPIIRRVIEVTGLTDVLRLEP